jgi:N-acetylneuraminate synthase
MGRTVSIGSRLVGEGQPCFIIAEIGINHNGDLALAKQLIDASKEAGADAVKFQKRTPEKCVPLDQRDIMRDTPWGRMTYMDYRYRVEFEASQFAEIDRYARESSLLWFSSCWDEDAVDFMEQFNPVAYKISSAALTDDSLLRRHKKTGRPIVLSTGMSTMEQIRHAVRVLDTEELVILHCTSTYPSKPEELNLRAIRTLVKEFPNHPIGYSGHEVGLQTSVAAVALGACVVERHITLDRSMWGTDQSASVEPQGFHRMVRDIRVVEAAMGDGIKRVYETELPIIAKLRRVGK